MVSQEAVGEPEPVFDPKAGDAIWVGMAGSSTRTLVVLLRASDVETFLGASQRDRVTRRAWRMHLDEVVEWHLIPQDRLKIEPVDAEEPSYARRVR